MQLLHFTMASIDNFELEDELHRVEVVYDLSEFSAEKFLSSLQDFAVGLYRQQRMQFLKTHPQQLYMHEYQCYNKMVFQSRTY